MKIRVGSGEPPDHFLRRDESSDLAYDAEHVAERLLRARIGLNFAALPVLDGACRRSENLREFLAANPQESLKFPEAVHQWYTTAGMVADQGKPASSREIARMETVLGRPLLGRLLGVSPATLRRYLNKGGRPREDISRRARFLAAILDDIAGSYTAAGQRLWFSRKRAKLGNRCPAEVLAGNWAPEDPDPRRVAELARWLRGEPAT